ncbi:hypothetical protein ACT6QG_15540 [Xanthobacter sp. TB0136]|uniref:hypothetical protein n=1 Tax=Xanthobacter sp. TB0136 TaxID=3459177 RepID=UPI00403A1A9E
MSYDALFQLGMGSVQLDATQTEDFFAARALMSRAKVSGGFHPRTGLRCIHSPMGIPPRHFAAHMQASTLKA